MPASEAQIRANQANAQKSTGPRTEEGKMASRGNAYKHGLTATKVLPELEAAEADRRYRSFCAELKPTGDVGRALVLRAATLSTRMERCVKYETAMLTERVRQAEADFVPPEGVDAAEAERLRQEAGKRALFDPSKEAALARKYEADAERGFLKAIKELRQHESHIEEAEGAMMGEEMGSNSPGTLSDDAFDKLCDEIEASFDRTPARRADRIDFPPPGGRIDVPFAIGKPR